MTLVEIREKIITHLEANWPLPAIPKYFDNRGGVDVNATPEFAKVGIYFDDARQIELSPNPTERTYGTLEILFGCPANTGSKVILGYVDSVKPLFSIKVINGIRFGAGKPNPAEAKGGWYLMSVEFPFNVD